MKTNKTNEIESVSKKIEKYHDERYKQFTDAFAALRQELVDDLAREYRKHGIPATFNLKIESMTLKGHIPYSDELTDALVSGDHLEIANAFIQYTSYYEAQRQINEAEKTDEDTQS